MSNAPQDRQDVHDWQRLRQSVLSVSQHRQVDREAIGRYRMHSLVLMENAARGCADWLEQRIPPRSDGRQRTMVLLCGKGNNGGDGLAIFRHAEALGWECTAFVAGALQELSPDARANAEILLSEPGRLSGSLIFWKDDALDRLRKCLAEADVVLDAMLGTGAQGEPKPPLADWIDAANASRGMRIAIDMPTGLDASSGQAASKRFRPDGTLTFVALKPAMVLPKGGESFGEIDVLPIGIPRGLMREILSWSRESGQ